MAVKVMTPKKGELNKITAFAFEAATAAADGLQFTLPKASDEYVVAVVHNSGTAAASITVKKPTDGSYYAAGGDETHQLAAGAYGIFRFESAKWANRDGTVLLVPSATTVVAAVLY